MYTRQALSPLPPSPAPYSNFFFFFGTSCSLSIPKKESEAIDFSIDLENAPNHQVVLVVVHVFNPNTQEAEASGSLK